MSLETSRRIVDRTNALNADIIVMLGDYVAGHRHVTRYIRRGEWAPVLAGLKAPLGCMRSSAITIVGTSWFSGKGGATLPARARSCRHSGLRKRRSAA